MSRRARAKSLLGQKEVALGRLVAEKRVAERYKAGESIASLADDYGRDPLDIEEAIRCELALEAA
jgi:uncharacterized protein (DUF433 family)